MENNLTQRLLSRRDFLRNSTSLGVGTLAFNDLLSRESSSNPIAAYGKGIVHFAPKAKSVIFLHMVGAPSQLDLFDPKPKLKEFHGKPAPAEFIEGKRFAFLRGHPKMMASPFEFAKITFIQFIFCALG